MSKTGGRSMQMAAMQKQSDMSISQVGNTSILIYYSSIDSFHIVISLSNRSSIEKSIKLFLKMKGQIAY